MWVSNRTVQSAVRSSCFSIAKWPGGEYGTYAVAEYTTHPTIAAYTHGVWLWFMRNGTSRLLAGNGGGISGDGAPATSAGFGNIMSIAVDPRYNIYVATAIRLRRISGATRLVSTVAGDSTNWQYADRADGSLLVGGQISNFYGMVSDAAGNIVFADHTFQKIRLLYALNNTYWHLAGGGSLTPARRSNVIGVSVSLNSPVGVAMGRDGTVYFSHGDIVSKLVRASPSARATATPSLSTGSTPSATASATLRASDYTAFNSRAYIWTVAGNGSSAVRGGDGGMATSAALAGPQALLLDEANRRLYVSQAGGLVRVVDLRTSRISTLLGNGSAMMSVRGSMDPRGLCWLAAGTVLAVVERAGHRLTGAPADGAAAFNIMGTGCVCGAARGGV